MLNRKIEKIKNTPKQIRKMEDCPHIGSVKNWTTTLPMKFVRKHKL